MSKLTKLQKEVMCRHIKKGFAVVEVFPGSNESIDFLKEKSGRFFAFSNEYISGLNLSEDQYIQINCPPFPDYKFQFDMIFICQLYYIQDYFRKDFVDFLETKLKMGGILILTCSFLVEISNIILLCKEKNFNFDLLEFYREDDFNTIFILKKIEKDEVDFLY